MTPDSAPFHPGLFEWPVALGTQPRLVASRCPACERHAYPAKHFCPFCQNADQLPTFLSGRGRVYAFTTVDLPPKLMGSAYVAAYVDMDEGVRLFAQIHGAEPDSLRTDDRVQVEFRTQINEQGDAVVSYVFVPTRDKSP